MAKSLIKTVDGIGIWVRDDAVDSLIRWEVVVAVWISIVTNGLIIACYGASLLNNIVVTMGFCLALCGFIVPIVDENYFTVPAYKIYNGSDESKGIIIPKTTDTKVDQIAICKATQQIESQCREIAAKRAELDRIAAGCK